MRTSFDAAAGRPPRCLLPAGRIVGLAVLVAGLAGCRTAAPLPPFTAPPVELVTRAFHGPPLGDGAVDTEREEPPTAAFRPVVAEVLALESFPSDSLLPASRTARLVSPLEGDEPFLPTGRRTRRVRFDSGRERVTAFEADVRGGAFGELASIGTARGALAPGVTMAFRLESEHRRDAPGRPDGVREVIEVLLHRRPDGALECGLELSGFRDAEPEALDAPFPSSPPSDEGDGESAPRPVADGELALFRVEEEGEGGAVAFAVPSPFVGRAAAVVFLVRVEDAPGAAERLAHRAAVERTVEELAAPRRHEAPPPAPLPLWPGAREALAGLRRDGQQRSALAYLSGRAAAAVAEEVALTGADETVDRLARSVVGELEEAGLPVFGERLAWLLERTAYATLVEEARGGDGVSEAVLIRHAGELGRSPGVLLHAVRRARNQQDLDRVLSEENLAALGDLDPSARVRAYDWLASRGEAPEGYDPLAARDARRAALRRHEARDRPAAAAGEER